MKRHAFSILILLFVILSAGLAQLRCAEAAATRLPWRLSPETKTGSWAKYMKPVVTEMQRLFPQPPGGLELTFGIYDAMGSSRRFNSGTQFYEGFVMIRDIVCENWNGMRKIIPEGETGCWFYVRANDFRNLMTNFMNGTGLYTGTNQMPLFSGDIRLIENANGMMSVYVHNNNDEATFAGWFFSTRRQLPIRKISKKELAQAYRSHWVKKLQEDNLSLQKTLTASREGYKRVQTDNSSMKPGEKQKVLQSFINSDKKTEEIISSNLARIADCQQRTRAIEQAADANEPARTGLVNGSLYDPEQLTPRNGGGQYMYAEDESYFNNTLPAAQPQFVVASLRRQDISPAKTAFINKVEETFDWNIVRRMVGAGPMPQALTISGMGNSPGGYTSGPLPAGTITPAAPGGIYFNEDFSGSNAGKAPAKWTVSNTSAVVKNIDGSNWLALKNTGLFFPDYAVLQLPEQFTLSFELSWNPAISYYSPDFLFHIGAAAYDNTLKRYDRAQVNVNAYTAARMERICLWIDPHWNSSGRYGMQVFDAKGGYLYDKAAKATQFFKEKSQVRVKLVRNGTELSVYFNDEPVTQLPAAMQKNIRWNFFGFGLGNAPNADPEDEFYITNIRLTE